jgi:UDP-N-acetylmuramate dehydrogenase
MNKYAVLTNALDPKYVKLNEPLAKHTTVKIGGPADIWYEAQTTAEFIKAIRLARELEIPITIIGRGANVLISDNGIRGLVLKNSSKQIEVTGESTIKETQELEVEMEARWESVTSESGGRTMYEFKDLDYDESGLPKVEVKVDSGVDMPFAINYLLSQGLTGLQWYARIPGTLGGWIHNNVHGGSHFITEVIKNVQVLTENNEIKEYSKQELGLGYDQSRFHHSNEIILSATLELYKGDQARARAVFTEWAKRKSIQPPISVGCIFQNISQAQKAEFNYPTTSVGYIVEFVLQMKGFRIGDAAISTMHHNFIENKGSATAADYLAVIKEIQKRSKEQLGIELKPEIFFYGFSPAELAIS